MTGTGMLTWPVKRRDDFLRIVAYIVIATGFIFAIDIITPLGVMIWILYLIPLFLTVYLRLEICTSCNDRCVYSPDVCKSFPVSA